MVFAIYIGKSAGKSFESAPCTNLPDCRSASIEDWKAVTCTSAIAPFSEAGIESSCAGA